MNTTLAGDERLPITPRARERRRDAKVYTRARASAHAEEVAEKKKVSVCCKWSQCGPVYVSWKRIGKIRQAYRASKGQTITRTKIGGKKLELVRPSDTCMKAKTRWRNNLSSFIRFRT